MIEVEKLTKYYGSFPAAEDITFTVPEGEIVGLLGPNGAGKTTVLRMLTCFMPASSGRATVDGYDIFTQSLKVRGAVGYMPESVPLYEDMRVEEYLGFRARLKGIGGAARRQRVDDVLNRCQLTPRRRQLIGTLSKGYRQRVGLAEALIGDPKVLILDEPTIGLDPGQILEVRRLIHDLGRKHTILLSSHILHEVEQVCSRIIMLARGHVVANGRMEDIKQSISGAGRVVLEARGEDAPGLRRAIEGLHGIKRVSMATAEGGYMTFTIEPAGRKDIREEVCQTAVRRNWTVRELHSAAPSLEEFFVQTVARDNLGSGEEVGSGSGDRHPRSGDSAM